MKNTRIDWQTKLNRGVIRKINGGNLAPPLAGAKAGRNIRPTFGELNMPLTRLHDAPLDNAAMRLVDVPLIFANFHADVEDPRNYYFRQTDDYINNCLETGTGIYYRLGVSIEHGEKKYFTDPPADVMKWVEICDRIIRHYTEGWNNGFRHDIRYWEIWNEPECTDADGLHLMWSGSVEEYNRFYVTVATELKKRFPHLLFGGPAHCGYGDLSKEFIRYCAEHKAPLDFYSYHCYAADPFGWIQETPGLVRKDLDAAGYTNAEVHLNEWHYFHADWKRLRAEAEYKERIYKEFKEIDSAAFTAATLTLWQDTPLDMGCFYTASSTVWGIYQTRTNLKTKLWHGLAAFGNIVRYPERTGASSSDPAVTALAGHNAAGKQALLVTGFKTGDSRIEVDADLPLEKAKLRLLDAEFNLEEVPFTREGSRLVFETKGTSFVALLEA